MFESFQGMINDYEGVLKFRHFRFEMSSFNVEGEQAEGFLRTVALNQSVMEGVMLRTWHDPSGKPIDTLLTTLLFADQEKARYLMKKFL